MASRIPRRSCNPAVNLYAVADVSLQTRSDIYLSTALADREDQAVSLPKSMGLPINRRPTWTRRWVEGATETKTPTSSQVQGYLPTNITLEVRTF